jgi:uncharacterized membrane protein
VSRRLLVIAGLALVGLGIATYLTVVHYTGAEPVCAVNHGCETVQKSKYADLAGVPVALIGLIGYVSILASLAIRGENGRLIRVAITAIGFLFSAYLTYLELFQIHAICQWCVGSAVLMTALMVLTLVRLLYEGPRTSASPDSATAQSATDAPAAISNR